MPNFFTDNPDLRFRFDNLDLDEIIRLREGDFSEFEEYPHAPTSVEDARDSYRRVLDLVGAIAGDFIEPRATDVDREGAQHADGVVTYAQGTQEAIRVLAEADLMGFTLPRKYGGLNLPTIAYTAAIEMVSRADAALMTIFGLQDIAETINDFATEEQKDRYLPRFCSGEVTGAMVLTEPDAGSDLQAVRLKAAEDPETGLWKLNGVKRFITNGCGDVLLVLARSEPGTRDGRGLSMFICEKGPRIVIRRIEDKLGIHGSPTCEMQFNDAPGELVGQRRRGLIKYVMSLMNGARVGIAAQALGIAEAAYRAALAYALTREQFGKKIIDIPPVSNMLVNMKVGVETGRSLLYETACAVDMYQGLEAKLEEMDRKDADYRELRKRAADFRKLADVLTPMSKYYCCEMCLHVTTDAIQVHGGSGYMRDYDVERYYRDARITSIYEGTSELQVVAIMAGLHGGNLNGWLDKHAARDYPAELAPLAEKVNAARQALADGVGFVKEKGDSAYTDLVAHHLADMAVDVFIAYQLLRDAQRLDLKKIVAQRFINQMARRAEMNLAAVKSGDDTILQSYRRLLGPDVAEG